jgi:hypothetical protein
MRSVERAAGNASKISHAHHKFSRLASSIATSATARGSLVSHRRTHDRTARRTFGTEVALPIARVT